MASSQPPPGNNCQPVTTGPSAIALLQSPFCNRPSAIALLHSPSCTRVVRCETETARIKNRTTGDISRGRQRPTAVELLFKSCLSMLDLTNHLTSFLA